jgi:hypothetical protein
MALMSSCCPASQNTPVHLGHGRVAQRLWWHGGDKDERNSLGAQVRIVLDVFFQLKPRHSRHIDVGKEDKRLLVCGGEIVQGLFAITEEMNLIGDANGSDSFW